MKDLFEVITLIIIISVIVVSCNQCAEPEKGFKKNICELWEGY